MNRIVLRILETPGEMSAVEDLQRLVYLCDPILNEIKKIICCIPIKEGENIERALKKYKKKYEKTGVLRQLRERQVFTKPSVVSRQGRLKAIYKQKLNTSEA